mgnify:CR=1 FL=1
MIMKKKHINLIATTADYQKLEIIFRNLRIATLVAFFAAILISLGLYIVVENQNKIMTQILNEKKILLQGEKYDQEKEAKLLHFKKSFEKFDQFLKNDANAFLYYQILNSTLSQATQSALIKNFKINKNREADFIVIFANFDEMLNFLRFDESKGFLDKFDHLILKSFSMIKGESLINNYELSFSGRFKNLHETQN